MCISCTSNHAILNQNAVVKSRDIPICKLLAKCREVISLVDFLWFSGKCVTSYLLMNINELMLLP